jgi:capsular exopolysaccharide synthesis family protein
MMVEESSELHTGYLRLFRRIASHWRLSLLICGGVAAPVAVWALLFLPKNYEAVATIFLEDARRGPVSILRDWIPSSDASFQNALLRSRTLAEAVVDTLPADTIDEMLKRAMYRDYLLGGQNLIRRLFGREPIVYSKKQRVVQELVGARVRFVSLPSGEVEIRAVAYHPRVAMDLANTYVAVLQTQSRSHIRDEARATRQFIENLLAQTKASLQEAEDSLAKLQVGGGGRLRERPAVETAQLVQLETNLADIQASKEIVKVRLNSLKTGTGPAVRRTVSDRLAPLEAKLAALLEKYTPEHPLVKAAETEINELRATLAARPASSPGSRPAVPVTLNPAEQAAQDKQIADLEVELASLQAREEVVKQRVARLSSRMSTLSAEELEQSKVLRRVETHRSLYATLSEKLGTARAQEQGEDRGLRVIDLATLPLSPNTAPVKKIILLGVLLGLGLGAGVAAVIEYFNQPIESEDDVIDVTGLPVLGWLPTVPGQHPTNGVEREPLSFVDGSIPDTLPVEGCRSIRTSLESLDGPRKLQSIMLSSAGPKEGKSTIVLNLAWVFWELGRRLIMVDADLRRPSLHRAFRCSHQPGLADMLVGDMALAQAGQAIREGLVLLPAGSTGTAKPGVLLTAAKLRGFLERVTSHADLVIFDSAPVLAVADNLILASLVDGVILVVRAGETQRHDLVRAKDLLEKAGATLLGVVLNQVSPRETRRYYGRYGDYYGVRNGNVGPWWRRYRFWGTKRTGVMR